MNESESSEPDASISKWSKKKNCVESDESIARKEQQELKRREKAQAAVEKAAEIARIEEMERQIKISELREKLAHYELDSEQCNEVICRYGREFHCTVSDLDKLSAITPRPVEEEVLMDLGLSRHLTPVEVVRIAFSILDEVTPSSRSILTQSFIDLQVHKSTVLKRIVSHIYEKGVNEPDLRELYAMMCFDQVSAELRRGVGDVSLFRDALRERARDLHKRMPKVEKLQSMIENETDDVKRLELQKTLRSIINDKRRFEYIIFIGHLFNQDLISRRLVCRFIVDLLKSTQADDQEHDEESIECAVSLLEVTGKRLHELFARVKATTNTSAQINEILTLAQFDNVFSMLQNAMPAVSIRIRYLIMNLLDQRANGWEAIEIAEDALDMLDEHGEEIEPMENEKKKIKKKKSNKNKESVREQLSKDDGVAFGDSSRKWHFQ